VLTIYEMETGTMSAIDKMEFWGPYQISEFTRLSMPRVYQVCREREFPLPAIILSERQRAWHRTAVLKWWKARKEKADA